ncbi:hypothetical protein BCR44DRAFT_1264646 [Catenaria anguillulae PL171]|uniref:Uncharacterized protein n=1 Tax=Catenaria anguillulae PL171 TaxID=765915 RepID=A0A1Y2HAD4_9FUNG|nr:hypothetical protein BCR44DRAFT_1264646 [Catenaria anguillulae PL171]
MTTLRSMWFFLASLMLLLFLFSFVRLKIRCHDVFLCSYLYFPRSFPFYPHLQFSLLYPPFPPCFPISFASLSASFRTLPLFPHLSCVRLPTLLPLLHAHMRACVFVVRPRPSVLVHSVPLGQFVNLVHSNHPWSVGPIDSPRPTSSSICLWPWRTTLSVVS